MDQTFYTLSEEPTPSPAPVDPKEARRTFSRVGLALTVLVTVMMVAAYVIQFAVLFTAPRLLDAWWMTWVVSLLPLYAVALPCAYLILRKIPVNPHNTDYVDSYNVLREKTRFGFGHWMILLVMGLGCMYLGNIVGNIIMQILSDAMDYDYANALNEVIESSPTWMVFVGTCICAPIGEELIFRKLLLDRTRGYGEMPAILLSGLLFGLFHGNLFQFFYAFLLGMILAYVYTRSGKIGWCMAFHAAVNFLGSIAVPRLAALLPTDPEAELTLVQALVSLGLSAWMFGLIITAVVLVCSLWHKRKLSRGSLPLEGGRTFGRMLCNPGMMVCVVIMLLLLAVNLIPIRT
ncbi:MAG: CPBP family intramembrane metalloprotease [Clostridia bacterium]|nr:CPBP family intramembrane metalloprotease [Clostridia bacterium]